MHPRCFVTTVFRFLVTQSSFYIKLLLTGDPGREIASPEVNENIIHQSHCRGISSGETSKGFYDTNEAVRPQKWVYYYQEILETLRQSVLRIGKSAQLWTKLWKMNSSLLSLIEINCSLGGNRYQQPHQQLTHWSYLFHDKALLLQLCQVLVCYETSGEILLRSWD